MRINMRDINNMLQVNLVKFLTKINKIIMKMINYKER